MSRFSVGDVWIARFPLEEDSSMSTVRPVIVLDDNNTIGILSVKVTSHKVREYDPYDTPIIYWDKAGLRVASTARVSKTMILDASRFQFKLGVLQPEDLTNVQKQYIELIKSMN